MKPSLPSGLEVRKNAVRARARRTDQAGRRHDVSETFPFDASLPAAHRHSRASAIARATAWIAEQRRALHLDKARVGERLADVTLGDWFRRYRQEIERAKEPTDDARPGPAHGKGEPKGAKPVGALPEHAHKKGASKEANVLLGWEARFPKLCAMVPSEVTPKHLREAMKTLAEKHHLSSATIGRWIAVLSAVYKAASEEWQFEVSNPAHRLRRPRVADGRQRLIGDSELKAILEGMTEASPETRKAIEFLRWTGCRRGEATNLAWKDVDWSKPIVEVTFRDTKDPRGRKRHRTIPLSPEAEAVLRSLFDGDPPVKGKPFPIHADSLTTAWGRGCARATPAILDARVHDLRHTRLTEITARLPILDAQKISGHIDLRMLQRYYHPTAQEIGKRWLEVQRRERKETERATPDDAVLDALIDRIRDDPRLKRRLLEKIV